MNRGQPLAVLEGVVVHGRGNGHKVGMPTANLRPDPGQALPPDGVYATLTWVEAKPWVGVTNVGNRPSVDDDPAVTVETYMPGYAGDLYGRRLRVEFYLLLRPVKRFDSLEAVKEQCEQGCQPGPGALRPEGEGGAMKKIERIWPLAVMILALLCTPQAVWAADTFTILVDGGKRQRTELPARQQRRYRLSVGRGGRAGRLGGLFRNLEQQQREGGHCRRNRRIWGDLSPTRVGKRHHYRPGGDR